MEDSLFGNWELDSGSRMIREVPFPSGEPDKEDIPHNQYALFVETGGLLKKKVTRMEISVLNSGPRDAKGEKLLMKRVRARLEDRLKSDVIRNSGGVDRIIVSIKWSEWW